MNKSLNSYYAASALILIIALGAVLHFYRIGYPDSPVFDEAHFATYADDYATGQAFIDIHPPLGKLIYASVLLFYPPQDLANGQFSKLVNGPTGKLSVEVSGQPYGNFPYIPLRVVSALFDIFLPVVFYFFMRNIGVGRVGSILSAFFILFDNALLMNSRLIFMDSMMMFFGITALAIYFHKKRPTLLAGIFFGLALAVKLTAIIFVGPAIVAFFLLRGTEKKLEFKRLRKFAVAAVLILISLILIGTCIFPTSARLNTLYKIGVFNTTSPQISAAWQAEHPIRGYFAATIGEELFSLSNYIEGDYHDGASPWYFWPTTELPILFYAPPAGEPGGNIELAGNPVSWILSTLAVIIALALSVRYFYRHRKGTADNRSFLLLLGGYAGCLLPFIILVHRSTFLYHYLPALLFAYGLLGWCIAKILKLNDFSDLKPRQVFHLAIIILVVIAGFLAVAPLTYGL